MQTKPHRLKILIFYSKIRSKNERSKFRKMEKLATFPTLRPNSEQPTFKSKCNICFNYIHRSSKSHSTHSQEPCEWFCHYPGVSPTGRVMGVVTPALLKNCGSIPAKLLIFQKLYSWNVHLFVFSNIFKIKWPKSEEKLNFVGMWVCVPMGLYSLVPMNPTHPRPKLCGDAAVIIFRFCW